jgi:hypothetical protein
VDVVEVAAVIPTRGDVDLEPILASLAGVVSEIVVWDNSEREDLKVYGRYAAIAETDAALIYTQDDDCLVSVESVLACYEPGRLVANMPRTRWDDYPDSTLVGWGSVFDRELPERAFRRFAAAYSLSNEIEDWGELFLRTADVVFSALTPRSVLDLGFAHLPWAEREDRMFRQPGHARERQQMLERCRAIRDADDDRRKRE